MEASTGSPSLQMGDNRSFMSNYTSTLSPEEMAARESAYWMLVYIHIVAFINLCCSVVISIIVIVIILKKHRNIFKRPIGERLVLYLACGDLCFSTAHLTDHLAVLLLDNAPPKVICSILGMFMTSFFNTPCVIVVVTAVNAFTMVVLQKKINLGEKDWRLLVGAFVMPLACAVIYTAFGMTGNAGAWCGFDITTAGGRFMANLNALLTIAIFSITILCYFLIWGKIRSVANQMLKGDKTGKAAESASKYHKSARVMMIFVATFALQYWAITVYYIWEFFGAPHLFIIFMTVTFTNQGGLFNFMAYTIVRKKYSSTEQGGGGGGGESTTATKVDG